MSSVFKYINSTNQPKAILYKGLLRSKQIEKKRQGNLTAIIIDDLPATLVSLFELKWYLLW